MRPHPRRAETDFDFPRAWGTSDRDGFIRNLSDMRFQLQWSGNELINTRVLVGPDEYDIPQEQFRTLIIPADPPPLLNARPEPYVIDETDWLTTGVRGGGGDILETENNIQFVTMPSATEATNEDTG